MKHFLIIAHVKMVPCVFYMFFLKTINKLRFEVNCNKKQGRLWKHKVYQYFHLHIKSVFWTDTEKSLLIEQYWDSGTARTGHNLKRGQNPKKEWIRVQNPEKSSNTLCALTCFKFNFWDSRNIDNHNWFKILPFFRAY